MKSIQPSNLIAGFSANDGMNVDDLYDWCGDLGLIVSGTKKVLIDRIEGDYYIGRTQYDSPEVDDEILISVDEAELNIGDFVNVKLVKADYFDLYGNVIS